MLADLEHLTDAGNAFLASVGNSEPQAAHGLGDLLLGLVPTSELRATLDAHSPERQATNTAHEAWLCAKYGIDPAEVAS